jgi:hypothetical protein
MVIGFVDYDGQKSDEVIALFFGQFLANFKNNFPLEFNGSLNLKRNTWLLILLGYS